MRGVHLLLQQRERRRGEVLGGICHFSDEGDANANWIMTEMEIFREQLPAAVNTAYEESGYGDWVIDNLTKLTFPHKSEEFVFEVQRGAQERALYYSAYGGLLLEKDITDADDTHWPDVE